MVKYHSRTLDRTFAALADPTRRRILAHLARGSKRVTHLARPHAMSLPAVSKHLRVLESAGLLRRRRYGRVHQMQLEAGPHLWTARLVLLLLVVLVVLGVLAQARRRRLVDLAPWQWLVSCLPLALMAFGSNRHAPILDAA